ncbi:hypothetical protein Efla_005849 [Eimeria flavescens]
MGESEGVMGGGAQRPAADGPAVSPAASLEAPSKTATEGPSSDPHGEGLNSATAGDASVGRPTLASMTERFLSLDFDALGKALERFKFDPRLAVALRVPPQAAVPTAAVQPKELPPPPPPLDFHRVYSSVDTLLAVHEQQALQVYAESCPQMLSLDKEIEDSERLLAGVEARLHALSEDLGASGANTRNVEQQSSALATKARNRREAYLLLRTYLQQITLTRSLVKAICEGSLEDDPKTFLKALRELEKKIEHAKQPGMRQYKSTEASLPELYRLRDCAAQRITSHIQQRMSLLRQPRTNIHIIQRGELLKHKDLYLFLTDQAPSSAIAVKDEYTRTISSVYASLFKTYHSQLLGMLLESSSLQQQSQGSATIAGSLLEATQQTDSDDLMVGGGKGSGSIVASARQVMGFLTRLGSGVGAAGSQQTPSSLLCSLGNRDSILQDLDAEPLVAVPTLPPAASARRTSTVSVGGFSFTRGPSAESAFSKDDAVSTSQGSRLNGRALYYEQLFRSHQKLLLDTATSELIFLTDFFLNAGLDTHYQSLFDEVFKKTKSFFLSALQDVLQGSADAIGVILMLRINQHNRIFLQALTVYTPVLPLLQNILSQRLSEMLLTTIKSLKAARLKDLLPALPGGQVVPFTTASHPIAHNVGELASALAFLQQAVHGLPALPEEPLRSLLIELQTAALEVLKGLSQEIRDERSRLIFLLNNYDTMLALMHERRVLPESSATLEQLLWESVGAYVEKQLEEHFCDLVTSVRAAEGALASDPAPENPAAVLDLVQVERAVTQFHATWRRRLGQLHEEAVASFPNSTNAMEILKHVLTQLLLLYTRLQQIVNTCFPKPPQPAWARQLVPVNTILTEAVFIVSDTQLQSMQNTNTKSSHSRAPCTDDTAGDARPCGVSGR